MKTSSAPFRPMGPGAGRKARGMDAGGWFDGEVGDDTDPKSISHEFTFRRRHGRCGRARIHAGAAFGNGGPPPARARPARAHHAAQAALHGFFHHSRAPIRSTTPRRLDTESSSRSALCSAELEDGSAQIRLLGVHAVGPSANRARQLDLLDDGRARALGTRRWRRPIACATSTASRLCHSPPVSVRVSANARENPAGLPGKPK